MYNNGLFLLCLPAFLLLVEMWQEIVGSIWYGNNISMVGSFVLNPTTWKYPFLKALLESSRVYVVCEAVRR